MGFTIYHDAKWVQPRQGVFLFFLIVYFVLVRDGMDIFRWLEGIWMAYDGVIFGG